MNPKDTDPKSRPTSGLEENLKKALTELLILFLFGEGEHYIGELSPLLETRSHGTLSIVFPYAAIYRITAAGYLTESEKRPPPTGGCGSTTPSPRRAGPICRRCWPPTTSFSRVSMTSLRGRRTHE